MMKGTIKKRYTLVSLAGQDLFEFQILAIFALKFALKQASNAWYTLKTAKLSKSKVLKHPPLFPLLYYTKHWIWTWNQTKQTNMCRLNNMLLFCKWEYSGESTWEAAYSLGSKGLQSLKVSNIWALPFDGFAM